MVYVVHVCVVYIYIYVCVCGACVCSACVCVCVWCTCACACQAFKVLSALQYKGVRIGTHRSYTISAWWEAPLVEFMYRVFTCMPGESYH